MMALRYVLPFAIVVAAGSACGTDTSTGNAPPRSADLTDPSAVSSEVATLDSAFAAPVTQSYLALAPLMAVAGGPGAAPKPSQSATCAAPVAAALGTPLRGGLASAFPDSILQHVFAWDSTSSSYYLTADVSGPPAGVRFLVYPVNPAGQVLSPSSPIGHLDLTDATGAGPLTLRALVTDGAGGGADYTIRPTGTASAYTAYTAVLAGSVTNGPNSATFSDTTGLVGSSFTVIASVDAPAADAHAAISATRAVADAFDNYYTLRFTLRHGSETVGLGGTISTFCGVSTTDLTVTVNTVNFATVTNDAHGLILTRVDGQPISTAQNQAVMDLLDLQRSLFQTFTTLFTPARSLLPQ